jgi:hypothetical protein
MKRKVAVPVLRGHCAYPMRIGKNDQESTGCRPMLATESVKERRSFAVPFRLNLALP